MEKYSTSRQPTDDNIIRRMRVARRITKATDTHSEYAILTSFPRQEWLRERASMLHYKHTVCLVQRTSKSIHSTQTTKCFVHCVL
jgi:hypothetical protein